MKLVIADTGPINYLLLIEHIDVLPVLFENVILPSAVRTELANPDAPLVVRNWIAEPPPWIEVRPAPDRTYEMPIKKLGAGEKAAIALAHELHSDLLLMDDRRAVLVARSRGFRVAGTLAILGMAAQHGLLNFADAFARIKRTSFRYRQKSWMSCSPRRLARVELVNRLTGAAHGKNSISVAIS